MKPIAILFAALFAVGVNAQAPDTDPGLIRDAVKAPIDATVTHPTSRVYEQCFMGEREMYYSSPYYGMTLATAHSLSHTVGHSMRACAAWHAANIAGVEGPINHQLAKSQMCIAAVLLNDPAPVLQSWNSWLRDMPNSAGYLVWASRRWSSDRMDDEMDALGFALTASQRAEAEAVADVVETFIPEMLERGHE